ncbi:hypothetical protein B7463_g2713, partial [Scytalidium lignicola]
MIALSIVDGDPSSDNVLATLFRIKFSGWAASTRNPFEAAPSYAELGKAAIAWLDELRKSHVIIEKIFFDGFLPPAKFDVRVERLIGNTERCIEYHQAYPGQIDYGRVSTGSSNVSASLFTTAARQSSSKLPAIPFLVPAVVEALIDSEEYRRATIVVPEEADLYCAKYVSQQGGIVFTGDSDLLAHELGSDGAVSFFQDIEVHTDGASENLYSQVYRISTIINRLGLPPAYGIKTFAFEMFMDPHGTFRRLLMQAISLKAVTAHKDMYDEFAFQYMPLKTDPLQTREPAYKDQWFLLRSLDPRISEYILQFDTFRKVAGVSLDAGKDIEDSIHIFLPVLLDCPTRTNAWEMSISIRLSAYALINLIVPEDQQKFTVVEHVKQLNKNGGREWQLPSIDEISDALTALIKFLEKVQEKLPGLSGFDYWTAVAVCQDVQWSSSNGKASLCDTVLRNHGSSGSNPLRHHKYSWDIVHFYALAQGSYYSFRILKQIMDLLASQKDRYPIPEITPQLSQVLETLPKLQDLPNFGEIVSIRENNYKPVSGCVKAAAEKDWEEEKEKKKLLESRRKPENLFKLLQSDEVLSRRHNEIE